MSKKYSIVCMVCFIVTNCYAQLKVGTNPTVINSRSILELESSSKALYLPRLTTVQRNAQSGWQNGMLIYNTDAISGGQLQVFQNGAWVGFSTGNGPDRNIYDADGSVSGNRIVSLGTSTLAFSSTASSGSSHFTIAGNVFSVDAVNRRVGIGTTAPSGRLEVSGAGITQIVVNNSDNNQASLDYDVNGSKRWRMITDPGTYNYRIYDQDNGADRLILNGTNGYLGLGISPNAAFQIVNGISNRRFVLWESANNDHQFFGLGINSGTLRYQVSSGTDVHRFYAGVNASTSNLLAELSGTGTRFYGNVGSGTGLGGVQHFFGSHDGAGNTVRSVYGDSFFEIDPGPRAGTLLWVGRNGARGMNVYTNGSSFTGDIGGYWGVNLTKGFGADPIIDLAVGDNDSGIRWNSDGNISIATNGGNRITASTGNGTGTASYDGDSNWDFSSDQRLKKDIEDEQPLLEKVMQLKVKRYNWKWGDPNLQRKDYGFIAQEVQPLFPDLVTSTYHEKLGAGTLALGYTSFGVIAIKAIQEQQMQIVRQQDLLEQQETQLRELKEKIARLKDMLDALIKKEEELQKKTKHQD